MYIHTMEIIRCKIHNNVMINYDKIDDQGLSPEFASMLLVVLIGGYTLVGGLGVNKCHHNSTKIKSLIREQKKEML